LLVLTKAEPAKAFSAVEWPTLFFFVGLFMVVEGLRSTGLLDSCAMYLLSLTGNDLFLTAMVILWLSAVASALIGAVPLVTTLIPVVHNVVPVLAGAAALPEATVHHALWWSLALGACLGGNGSMFGTAASIVVVEIARANRREVGFRQFMYYGVPVTLVSLAISTLYVMFRYIPR